MPESPYKREVEIVQRAISRLRSETDFRLIAELEDEQRAAGTGLEWYGITKTIFERFLVSRSLSDETRSPGCCPGSSRDLWQHSVRAAT